MAFKGKFCQHDDYCILYPNLVLPWRPGIFTLFEAAMPRWRTNGKLHAVACIARLYAMATTFGPEELAGFFDDLVRCETRLYNAVGEKLRAEHGIAASGFEALRYLRDHPSSRVADVAAAFAAGIGAISKGVDRLEARGYVARFPNPADGRSSLISLTASGAALVAEAERTFNGRLEELIAPAVSADRIGAARTALAALRRALEHARVGLPVG